MTSRIEKVLILAKTYPSPSAQFVETSCVAGVTEMGAMIRLYPVPFRMIEEGKQFKKWQWISVRVEKARKDHRPESHKLYVDDLSCGEKITPKKDWSERWVWLDKLPSFDDPESLDAARLADKVSLALLRPKKLLGLEITKARNSEWTDEEREKLTREQMQGELFSENEARKQVRELRKIPYDFYYHYLCNTPEGEKSYHHKLVDWEAGALFWNCLGSHGPNGWEAPFRAKLEQDLATRKLMFLMGNQHRFQDQWLIVSMIYPPKRPPDEMRQKGLF